MYFIITNAIEFDKAVHFLAVIGGQNGVPDSFWLSNNGGDENSRRTS